MKGESTSQAEALKRLNTFGFAVAFGWGGAAVPWLWWMGRLIISREPTLEAGRSNLSQLNGFWLGYAAMWLMLTLLFVGLVSWERRKDRSQTSTPRSFLRITGMILMLAMAARLILVFSHGPSLSDDIWRFIFDGNVLVSGDNPYRLTPQELDPDHARFQGEYALANRLNNPDLATIYLPTSQLVFGGFAWVANATDVASSERVDPDHAATVFRLGFVVVELAAMIMLAGLLYREDRTPWYLALYAWHPLPLAEFAGSGHQDILGIALMLLAILLWRIKPRAESIWVVPLALATCVKPMPAPAGLFLALSEKGRPWRVIRAGTVGAVVCGGLLALFLLREGGEEWSQLVHTAREFYERWEFQGSIFTPLQHLLDDGKLARRICVILLILVWLGLAIRRIEAITATRVLLLAALLLSTTAWPWYLLWAFALFPLRPSPALWVASLTMSWSYVVLGDVVEWTVPWWSIWLTYVPIYGALFIDGLSTLRSRTRDR
jgi:hypothetical protein